MNTTVISERHVKHKRSCDCAACRELRDGNECDQCARPARDRRKLARVQSDVPALRRVCGRPQERGGL